MQPSSRLPALDGIRGFACLIVLFSHAAKVEMLDGLHGTGRIGVMLFFTLSGFLMAHHYLDSRLSVRYWLAYAIRRIMRIYPVFIVMTLILWYGYEKDILMVSHNNWGFDWPTVLAHWGLQMGSGHLWTIVVEIKFYAAFAVIACLFLSLRIMPPVRTLLLAGAWVGSMLFIESDDPLSLARYLPFFLGGMALSSLMAHHPLENVPQIAWQMLAVLCPLAVAGALPVFLPLEQVSVWEYYLLFSPILVLTILAACKVEGWARQIFANPLIRFTGIISYSLYLLHPMILLRGALLQVPDMVKLPLAMGLLFAAAWLMYMLVEKPGIRAGKTLIGKYIRHESLTPRHQY